MGLMKDALKKLGLKILGIKPSGDSITEIVDQIAKGFDDGNIATKPYVNSLMSGALKRLIVQELPEEDIDTNTIYMVLDSEASQQGNVYNEYLYISEAWELIGTTAVSGVELYEHNIELFVISGIGSVELRLETTDDTPFTNISDLYQYFIDNDLIYKSTEHNYVPVVHYQLDAWGYLCQGMSAQDGETNKFQFGIVYIDSNKLRSVANAYTPTIIRDIVKPLQ